MNQFFSSLYCNPFEDLFGHDLAIYMGSHVAFMQIGNMFVATALTMMYVSLFVAVVYYYVIDHSRLACFQGWLIFAFICVITNMLSGWLWIKDIALGSSLGFGIANGLLSIPSFIILSFLCKWWSRNSSKIPI